MTHLRSSFRLSILSKSLSLTKSHHFTFRTLNRTHNARISCSIAPNEVQAPVVQTQDPKSKPVCYGVFCLTYDLKAEAETRSWKKLINIAVSSVAGMISNHLLFKLASGEVFGPDQPIALKLLGSERSFQAREGVAMELEDSLFPLLREMSIGIDPYEVFQEADWALLIGSKPRGSGMERAGLLDINGQIFVEQPIGKGTERCGLTQCQSYSFRQPLQHECIDMLKNAPNIPVRIFMLR